MSELQYYEYQESGEGRLLSQFKNKPNIKALLLSSLKVLQDTQDSLIDYSEANNLATGTGVILDIIGKIVGERRAGRLDPSYRESLYNRIVINTSEGTPNELLEILSLLSKGTSTRIYEHFPLTTAFYTNGSASSALAKTLRASSPTTSDVVSIYHDPLDNALIPSELENALGILVDDENNEFENDESRNIAVTYLASLNVQNSEKAILDELDTYDALTREPCEVYR
jgi:hypothetical protein